MLALTSYSLLKFGHVLLAIVAVGFNASYGIWLARAAREPAHLDYSLRGVKLLDDRFANPAYALLLVSGLAMVWVGDLDLTTFWLAAALVLYLAVLVVGLVVYTPTLKAQIHALEVGGPGSSAFQQLGRRSTGVGIALAVLVVVIVFLMVTKPTL